MEASDLIDNRTKMPTNASMYRYVVFNLGQQISILGSTIVQFALPIWVAFELQDDPQLKSFQGLFLGIAFALSIGPMVIVGLFAGPLIDKWNKKTVLLLSDGIQAVLASVLFFVFQLDLIEDLFMLLIFILSLIGLRSVVAGFQSPAVAAIIPLVVPKKHLTTINSMEQALTSIVRLVSPLTGALLIAVWGLENIQFIVSIDVITFLIAIIPTIQVFIPKIVKDSSLVGKESAGYLTNLKEGFSFVLEKKPLLVLVSNFTLVNIIVTPAIVLSIILVTDEEIFNYSAEEGTWILGIAGVATEVGILVSALLLILIAIAFTRGGKERNTIFKRNTTGVFYGILFIYVANLLLGVSGIVSMVWLFLFSFVLSGFSVPLANTHSQNIWQTSVPPELYARVHTVRITVAWVFNPISLIVAGLLADYFRADYILVISSVIGIVCLLLSYQFTSFKRVETDLDI